MLTTDNSMPVIDIVHSSKMLLSHKNQIVNKCYVRFISTIL